MTRSLTRRALLALAAATGGAALLPGPAAAVTPAQAAALVDRAVADINAVIASGGSDAAMVSAFERIFAAYADVPTIALYTLGVDARRATPQQRAAYVEAFRGYITRKYGRRFREFIGGRIVVEEARPLQNFIEVRTTAFLRGEDPFRIDFHVSDRSGRPAFFNVIIEGVNMLLTERTEIGALLDRRGGDIDALIQDMGRV